MDTTPAATAWPTPTDLPAIRAWATDNRANPTAVHRWAAPLLTAARRAGPIPLLGSPAWRALPPGDPRMLGAAVSAALAWLAEATPDATAGRLRAELDEFATGVRRMFVEASHDVSQAARERRERGYSIGPSHAELVRRRNTHRCWHCRTEFYGPVPCPNGCDNPEQTRARAAAPWHAGPTEVVA